MNQKARCKCKKKIANGMQGGEEEEEEEEDFLQ